MTERYIVPKSAKDMEPDPASLDILSPRESEILGLASSGYIDKEIGAELGVTLNTLRTHWTRIRTKIGDYSRTALVAAYVKRRIQEAGAIEQRSYGTSPSQKGTTLDKEGTGNTPSHNFPIQLTTISDSNETVARIAGILEVSRLVSISGIVGAAASQLAQSAAEEVRHRYTHGTWRIDLAEVSNSESIESAFANVFGIKAQKGMSLDESTMSSLKSKNLLLVIENCDMRAEECKVFYHALVERCPHIDILATSRAKLGCAIEQAVVLSLS